MNVNILGFMGLKLFCFGFKQLKTIMSFIWTKFKEDENTCNSCFKITSGIDKFGRMHIIWKDNSHYRVYTNLWRSFAQEIINKEDLIDKYGYIDVNKYNWENYTSSWFLLKSKRTLKLHCTCIARLTIQMQICRTPIL